MGRPTVAILDDQLPTRVDAERNVLDDVDVVWTGSDLQNLTEALPGLHPQVLVLQLERLGAEPIATAQSLTRLAQAELTLVTYAFARREVIKALQQDSVRAVRSPLSVEGLRAQMTSVIVRSLMQGGEPSKEAGDQGSSMPPDGHLRPPRFSPSQLARLESFASSVQCECPQHVSALLSSLVYFESYCKECENKNDEDARLHRMLYEQTAKARMLLEDGLERVLEHEDIRV